MSREYVNGIEFYKIFISGAKRVISNKAYLNKINVFPVADGDTGSNMEATLNSLINYTKVSSSFSETSNSMAEAAIIGARGNSGVIFAQYIKGIAESAKGYEKIHFKEFIELNMNSAQKLFEAISKPVEGTIVTVIRSWAEYLKANEKNIESFDEIFTSSLGVAEQTLLKTTEQLEVLKKNRVVDSGGKGFLYFLEGIRSYILNEEDAPKNNEIDLFERLEHQNETSKYRYCCECMLLESNYFREDIMKNIETFGDSLICIENDDKRRVHIHTNTPQKLFEKLSEFGNISMPKIEDMMMQQKMISDKADTAIITDSIADIPQDILDKYNIYTLNLNIQAGKSQFIDKLGVSREKVYEFMKSNEYPTSSIPNYSQTELILKGIMQSYRNIIVITVSSKLSGVYDICKKVSNDIESECRIKVIDSKLNSSAQGLLVYRAGQMLSEGKDFETLVDNIKLDIPKIEIYVALNTLKNVIKSGRVDRKSIKIASNTNLKAAISLDKDGNGTACFVSPSHSGLLNKILNLAKRRKKNNELSQYSISYSGNCKYAVEFAEKLELALGFPPLFIAEVSSVTALHVGENAVGVSFIE